MKLTAAEEQLMEHIWAGGRIYMKDLIESYELPRPAATTIATLLKRMQEKGFVGYTLHGNSRQYYPLVLKEDYFSTHFNGIIKNFFNNSPLQFASFFTTSGKLSKKDLIELKKIIDQQMKKKKS